jgi:hypothetical protein
MLADVRPQSPMYAPEIDPKTGLRRRPVLCMQAAEGIGLNSSHTDRVAQCRDYDRQKSLNHQNRFCERTSID